MSFSFDGNNKIIQIGDGITAIAVNDLYVGWKEWVISANNSVFQQAFRFVGGDPLPGSKKLGTTYFLMNGWKIRPYSGNHTLAVDGNLYTEDGSSPYVMAVGQFSVMIINSVSSLVDSTVQQLPEIEYASYNGGITIDTVLGTDSSDYPYGTPAKPCKTLYNVDEIAAVRGFNKVFVYGDLNMDSLPDGFVSDMFIYGMRGYREDNLIISNTLISNCSFENMYVSGACKIGSTAQFKKCEIDYLENVKIVADRCNIRSGYHVDADLFDCELDGEVSIYDNGIFSGVCIIFKGDNTSIVHGANTTISIDVHSGYVKIKNSTSGCLSEFNYKGGELEFDSSCTGGDFYAEGVGYLYGDPAALGMHIKSNHLISLGSISETNWNYDITTATDVNTVSGYLKNKVLSVAKFIGLS